MPRVTVKYFGTFSELTRRREEKLEFDGQTLDELIDFICSRYGRIFQERIRGRIRGQEVVFAVNGRVGDKNTTLNDGDEIIISYPVGGG